MEKVFVTSYIIYICVFSFLPKSVQTAGFLLLLFVSIYYLWLNRNKIAKTYSMDDETRKLKRLFKLFISVSTFYLLLSFVNLPQLWGIEGLYYDVSYAPRHFFIVAELFIPILLGYAIYQFNLFEKIKKNVKVMLLIWLYVILFFAVNDLCVKGLLLIMLTFIAWKLSRKWIMFLAFFINYEQSAYILGFGAMMFFLFFEKVIISFLSKNTTRKIILIMSVAIIGIFLLSGILMIYVENDPNSIWRLKVWLNEIESLTETYFTGVGFGSAYVTEDILEQVNNSNMYSHSGKGGTEVGLFIVANHSSLLNMFYRMGVLGGLLFVGLNVQIIRMVIKLYNQTDQQMRNLLWRLFSVWIYETVVIFLNPGLEMMQFALSYILSVSMLLAVVLEIQSVQRGLTPINPQ